MKKIIKYFLTKTPSYYMMLQVDERLRGLEKRVIRIEDHTAGRDNSLDSGERILPLSVDEVDPVHKERYEFAKRYINKPGTNILDIACGNGYGASILSKCPNAKKIIGIDISEDSIKQAKQFYSSENTVFYCADAQDVDCLPGDKQYDLVVSFETLEHLPEGDNFLTNITKKVKDGGLLIFSTPNHNVLPVEKSGNRFHVKHYTIDEIKNLLEIANFKTTGIFSQKNNSQKDVNEGPEGLYLIVVAQRK